jgi:hypothetical protein
MDVVITYNTKSKTYLQSSVRLVVWIMVLNATFNNSSVISRRLVLLTEETTVPSENHRPVAKSPITFSHNIVSSTARHERSSNSQL